MSNLPTEHLRLKQAAAYLNISLSTLWRLGESDPKFPKKIRIGNKLCFYKKDDLDLWMEEQR